MALTFTPVYPASSASAPAAVDPNSIPVDTRNEVEEAIAFFASKQGENVALTVEFPNKTEKAKWVGLAQSYALNRPKEAGEPFVLRVSPQRGTTESGSLQFRMYPKSEYDRRKAEAQRVRDAAKAAKANGEAPKSEAPKAQTGAKK